MVVRQYELSLRPPAYWIHLSDHPQLKDKYLKDFREICRFYTRVIGMFDAIIRRNAGHITNDELATWNEIFQQPLVYPPQEGTPLFRILPVRDIQPQSSPE